MSLIRSSSKLFLGKVGSKALGFLALMYFTRTLTPETLGIFFMFQAVLAMVGLPADFGLREAVVKRASERANPRGAGSLLTTAALLKLAPIALVVVALYVGRRQMDEYLGAPLVGFLIAAILLQQYSDLLMKALQGELRVGETATLQFLERVIWAGTASILIYIGLGLSGLIYGLLAGYVALFVTSWWKLTIPVGRPSIQDARSLLDYAKYDFLTSIGSLTHNWMDVFLIGLFLTQVDVSVYEVSWRLTTVAALFSGPIGIAMFPHISSLNSVGDRDQIERLIPRVLTAGLLFVIPMVFGVILVGKPMLGVLFGSEYRAGYMVLVVLMAGKAVETILRIFSRLLHAIDKPNLGARGALVGVVTNVGLNVLLIPVLGILGAAIATGLSLICSLAVHAWYVREFLSLDLPYRTAGWCTGAAIVMAGVLWWLKPLVNLENLVGLLGTVMLGALVYFALVFLFAPLRQELVAGIRRIAP